MCGCHVIHSIEYMEQSGPLLLDVKNMSDENKVFNLMTYMKSRVQAQL